MIGLSIGIRAGGRGSAPPPAAPAAFTMTQLAPSNRIYQRDALTGGGQGKGQGSVPVTLNVSAPGTLYARCRSAADGTTIVQAPWLAIPAMAAGSGARTIPGVDARLGWFFLDLSGDGATWTNGTTPIGMGALIAASGQSMLSRFFHQFSGEDTTTVSGAGVSVSPYGRLFGAIDTNYNSGAPAATPTTWDLPGDSGNANGAGLAEFIARAVPIAGVNVGVVAKVEGATAIAEWQAGQVLGDALRTTMDLAGGKFEGMIWFQGHKDSQASNSYAYYRAQLTTLFASLAAHNAFLAPTLLVAAIPNINSDAWGTPGAIETIRRASHDWAIANGATPVPMADLTLGSDGVHPLQSGSKRMGDHFYRALRPHFGASHDDKGAVLGTPAHAAGSAAIVIPFTLPAGASALSATGAAATRFKVYKRGQRSSALALDSATPITIDNAAKTITLKLAADPGQVPLDILPFGAKDPANDGSAAMLSDDLTDGDGIAQGRQLYASPTAAHVAAPSDLVLTAPVYGAGRFGTTLTGGKGATPTAVLPSLAEGLRLETWVRIDTPDSAIRVICGAGGSAWIGCQSNDLKLAAGGSGANIQSYPGVLGTGTWHHVALTVDAPGASAAVHLDGALLATIAVSQDYDGSTNPLGVRCFGGVSGFDLTTQSIDEVAVWRSTWPATVLPAAPYAGNEPGLIGLWHLDGGGANSAGG